MKDPRDEQDEQAQERAEAERKTQLLRLRKLLGTDEGFDLVCRILDHCRVLDSVWSPGAEIHRLAGKQEVGQWLFREIAQAWPEALGKICLTIQVDEPKLLVRTKEK